jgi:uncharacterized repeat protein (TIGR01451 family)
MIPRPFKTIARGAALSVLLAGGAMAQTAPDTLVTNTISLTYNSGGTTPTVTLPAAPEHTVQFRVDRKLDLGVIAQSAGGLVPVVPGQSAVSLPFRVENRGNGTQGFVIDVADTGDIAAAGGLTYSATATTDPGQYYVMVGPNADGSGASVYNVTAGGNASDLAPGGHHFVFVIANVPITATDGQLEDFVVRATVTDAGTADAVIQTRDEGLMGVNRVFTDAASTSTRTSDPIDPALDGKDADETRIILRAPVLTATKTAVVLDEALPGSSFNCAAGGAATGSPLAAIPGACLAYVIEVTNTSPSETAATNVVITDPLADQPVTFRGASNITYTGTNAASAVTTTQPALSGTTVSATIGTLPAGVTATFQIRATID